MGNEYWLNWYFFRLVNIYFLSWYIWLFILAIFVNFTGYGIRYLLLFNELIDELFTALSTVGLFAVALFNVVLFTVALFTVALFTVALFAVGSSISELAKAT